MMIVAADTAELGALEGALLGVGPIVAAARMGHLLATRRPRAVVLVGTCGSYGDDVPLGCAIVSHRLGFAAGVDTLGAGYVPRAPEPLLSDGRLGRLLDVPKRDVLTCPAITTSVELARAFADQGWQIEHMEAFAAALACREAGVPFTAVLGVANRVGPDAHAEWLVHRVPALEAAHRAVQSLREEGPE